MSTLRQIIKRNVTLFFKDKGLFFTSLITPLILLVLYATFLANVYEDSFVNMIPEFLSVDQKVINGLIGGQLLSSLLSVSCITVSFCSNMLSVQDKVSKASDDLLMTPCKREYFAIGYFISTFVATLIICIIAMIAGMIYLGIIGWYLTFIDIIYIFLDVIILVLFGTTLSTFINYFLSSQGHISAVGSIVSSCYGFLCGAYMPISQFSEGLQKALKFFPGTYGTSLMRKHTMGSAFKAIADEGVPSEMVDIMKSVVDYNISFNDKNVDAIWMYVILIASTALFMIGYILLHKYGKTKKK